MNPIIEKVKAAIRFATEQFEDEQRSIPHFVLAMKGKTLPELRARAAIRATLEHLREDAKPYSWMNEHGRVITPLYDLKALIAELDAE